MPRHGHAERGTLLVSPHSFRSLEIERTLADEFGLRLVESAGPDDFKAGLRDAEIVLLTPYARLDASDFRVMARCRAVVRYGAGFDNVDLSSATVPVSIVPNAYVEEVASHALALGLGLLRRIPQARYAISNGTWAGGLAYDSPRLSDLTVGVVGMGRIGRLVARFWTALGADVIACDPAPHPVDAPPVSLSELLTRSDLVTLHVPLDDTTRGLISSDGLAGMRSGAILVNVSRGGLVDEAALSAALRQGRIGGAGLDVFIDEPLERGHVFEGLTNVLLTPHIAWRSNRSLDALQRAAVQRAREALLGRPMPDVVSG
jgi:D-3-phosphoglycerate dehydrogenase / 2-oxoglutarate reductase